MPPSSPDVVLLATEWRPRALLRAQLIEEGFEVLATDTWKMTRRFLRPGSKPRVVIVDLQGLVEPGQVLEDLRKLMPPDRVIVLTAMGTVAAPKIRALGFQVVKRPIRLGSLVAAAARALGKARTQI
jgi:DNA-binding NtrC family response regulator